jgi:23S rRNA pseudouridine1911/1915/1917 synthase
MIVREELPELLAGDRLDKVVALLADISRTDAQRRIDAGAVLVDAVVVRTASTKLKTGQVIEIEVADEADEQLVADPAVEFEVLYLDDDLIVVDKPAGLVVHPGTGHEQATLVHGLLARFPEIVDVGQPQRPGIVHRLDKGTSGLMVVARSNDAYESLVEQLSDHSVERVYQAIVGGAPTTMVGVVDAPLGRSRKDPTRMTVQADGKPSRTHYRVESVFTEPIACAHMRLELETGRTHQIRVHLAAIKHPVAGDPVYGKGASKGLATRPMLHAMELSLVHPATGDEVRWTSETPADFAALLSQLS